MRIQDYGIIGNCRSSALVSKEGNIDWCCLPDFDSPSVFARILDDEKGGYFGVHPKGEFLVSQKYINNTNILKTTFKSDDSAFEIIDFMPIYRTDEFNYYNAPEIYRIFRPLWGTPEIRIDYCPMLNYGKNTNGYIDNGYIKHVGTEGEYESVYLYSNIPLETVIKSEYFELNEKSFFCVTYNQKLIRCDYGRAYLEYQRTKVYWMNWSNRTLSFTQYKKEIIRSALILKLLIYEKSGAIVAAPTTSIPEAIGETRNWDYRFCWIRDSSMVIKTFLQLGHTNSARKFQRFILSVNQGKNEDLQIMFGIRGEENLEEHILEHLKGYRDSPPVRTGNAAYNQKQNDIYGVLVDAIWMSLMKFPSTLDTSEELWTFVRSMVSVVEKEWVLPDKGIWEMRGPDRHFVYSKLMSWVAIDRAVKIADMFGREFYVKEWTKLADTIKKDLLSNGWNEEVGAFTQYYGSSDLDSSNLLIEEFGLIDADDPRFISTVIKTKEQLTKNGFVFRYINDDDFGKPTGSFILCNFWLVNCLYKIGHEEEAKELFENTLSVSNHVGMLSEHVDITSRELLGNFPQAYSHLGLIQSALLFNGKEMSFDNAIFRYIKP
jgi:GH15 family glucan-1,4-alpha-glucosidase